MKQIKKTNDLQTDCEKFEVLRNKINEIIKKLREIEKQLNEKENP